MRVSCRSLASAGTLLLLATAPLFGQRYRTGIGVYGGGSWFTDLDPDAAVDTRLATNWNAGVQLEGWLGRVGLRLTGEYAERGLKDVDTHDFRLYAADLSLLVRLLPAGVDRAVAPYIAIGGGALQLDSRTGPDPTIGYHSDRAIKPVATVGLGADFQTASPLGMRLEVADRVLIESPFGDPNASGFHPAHEVIGRMALQLRLGRLSSSPRVLAVRPPRTRVAPPPPAPRESQPPREPEPPPPPQPPQPPEQAPSAPEPALERLTTRLDSVAAMVEAHTEDLMRIQARLAVLDQKLERQSTAVATAAPRPAPTASRGNRLYTVQVGAYRDRRAAEQLVARIGQGNLPVWVSQATVNGRTYYRVRAGALPNWNQAVQLAERLGRDHKLKTWVAPISPSENLPPDAVSATRAALGGS